MRNSPNEIDLKYLGPNQIEPAPEIMNENYCQKNYINSLLKYQQGGPKRK